MAGAGAWLLGRRKPYRRSALALGGLSVALLAGSAVLKTGFTFEGVIGYEQGNYAPRLYEAGLLAASPLVLAENAEATVQIAFSSGGPGSASSRRTPTPPWKTTGSAP